jgi:hypothetical protein
VLRAVVVGHTKRIDRRAVTNSVGAASIEICAAC